MPRQCASIKSKKLQQYRCPNAAKQGEEFCGIHTTSCQRWTATQSVDITGIILIQRWFRRKIGLFTVQKHGLAYHNRSICVNIEDFFSTDVMKDISGAYFFSYRDISDNLMYGFDIRSFNMMIEKEREKGEIPRNPYTRNPIPLQIIRKANTLVLQLDKKKMPTHWVSTVVLTPDQLWRMKVVEIFVMMEELQYGADPEWFIALSLSRQKEFYLHLMDIWSLRAGLSQPERERIVPGSAQLFHWGPARISGIHLVSTMRATNTSIIRRLISSAADRSDKILGAMYVLTALTQVCAPAAEAFPWLFESAAVSVQDVQQLNSWVMAVLDQYT
jgi:hypothetical protein